MRTHVPTIQTHSTQYDINVFRIGGPFVLELHLEFPADIPPKSRHDVISLPVSKNSLPSSDLTISIFQTRAVIDPTGVVKVVMYVVSRNMGHVYDTDLRHFVQLKRYRSISLS